MFTYLHFGGAALGTPQGPFLTVKVEAKESILPWKRLSATGYGSRIPSPYMVKWEGRWRRVYVACFSNAGTAYIGPSHKWLATVGEIER